MKLRALVAFAVLFAAGCSSSSSGSSTSGTSSSTGAASTAGSTSTGGSSGAASTNGSSTGAASTTGGSTGASASSTSGSSGTTSAYTFWADVAPILQQNCVTCHQAGAIAPFSLRTYQDAVDNADQLPVAMDLTLAEAAGVDTMPPWPPASSCNNYQHTRALTDAQKNILTTWATGGTPEGGPAPASGRIDVPDAGPALAHVDTTLSMNGDYLPQLSPDDYHCFIVPWTESTTKYVTGLTVRPGNAKIVHHVIAFVAGPNDASKYTALDTNGTGYTCFGGAGADDSANWLGAWAPGAAGGEFPANTGIRVDPGSVFIMQVHYNVLNGPGETDSTSVDLELADSVQKEAAVLPDLDPSWYSGNMPIPAGQADVVHAFTIDPTAYMSFVTSAIPSNVPITIWQVGGHMHLRGVETSMNIQRSGGGTDCLLDIPHWDFHWQGMYALQQPVTFNPGDQLQLTCHWNNTAANQPHYPDGGQLPAVDLNWGEGTQDEMCLGLIYVTAAN